MTHWEHFEHDADIGIRGVASTIEQAFEQAALALTAVITDPERISVSQSLTIHCEEDDYELLFLDWINELIYAMAVHRLLFGRFRVAIREGRLTATVFGERVDPVKHQPAVEIKGATFTGLQVLQRPGGQWIAQCIVDV